MGEPREQNHAIATGKGKQWTSYPFPVSVQRLRNFCGERAAVTKNAEDNDGNGLGDDEAIGEGTCLTRADSTQPSPVLATQPRDDYDDYDDLSDWEDSRMGAQSWTVAEAKAKFSEIIERAMSEGPQTITRKGRTAAVVVGAEEWQRKTKRVGNLAEFFAGSPLRGSGLKVRRLKERPRKINL